MRRTAFPLALLLFSGVVTAGTLQPVLDFASLAYVQTPPLSVSYTAGWQFAVSGPMTISALGVFDLGADGLTNTHAIGLWRDDGTLLAQATVDNRGIPVSSTSTMGRWLFTSITPFTLVQDIYRVGAFYSPNDADLVVLRTPANTLPALTFTTARFNFGSSLTYPHGGGSGFDDAGYFGANMAVTQSDVPEPGSAVLLFAGLATIRLCGRRGGGTRNCRFR